MYFIITVDTEGDSLWGKSNPIYVPTQNADYIQPFHELCKQYSFKPVYLTNYEMATNDKFCRFAKSIIKENSAEIGIHIHAWNNPPITPLNGMSSNNAYLIEYPETIMRQKIATTYNLIKQNIGVCPVSHRAGRWAMNDVYFDLLKEFNIKVDCSYTPGINWSKNMGVTMGGTDYTHMTSQPSVIRGILEVPMTISSIHHFRGAKLRNRFKNLVLGERAWIRPATTSIESMIQLINKVESLKNVDYVEFMIHSSELMPGGSPYFKTPESVNRMYKTMRTLFETLANRGYTGITLKDYNETTR